MDNNKRPMLDLLVFSALLACWGCSGPGLGSSDQGTIQNPNDNDGDGVWDVEEIGMFGTNPKNADSDGDGMSDRADPQPLIANVDIPARMYGVFADNASGTAHRQIVTTRYEQNHVVYAPASASGAPFLIYQTYLADGALDGSTDGFFDENDLPHSAIATMNIDGSRPRFLTDLDSQGRVSDNAAIDATPEPSPDGKYIIFVSSRAETDPIQLRLYVMEMDGSNPQQIEYAEDPPDEGELDADPSWGPDNTIAFKRQSIGNSDAFSRAYTAIIDTTTMALSNLAVRTSGDNQPLNLLGPGDYDPKVSPDGTMMASYRHLSNEPAPFGDWDVWVGPFFDTNQPAANSITILNPDSLVVDLFPRWNQASNKLALWSIDSQAPDDLIDIIVLDLDIQTAPAFTARVTNRINLTKGKRAPNGAAWLETMPSWNTDPNEPDGVVYSASAEAP